MDMTQGVLRPDGLLWLPKIGSKIEGGHFAGIGRGRDGAPDHMLICLGETPDRMEWEAAMAWAKTIGGELPNRDDARILFANLRELFKKDAYWSNEQYAGDGDYAWCQYFTYGDQLNYRKSHALRARAVRRLVIQ